MSPSPGRRSPSSAIAGRSYPHVYRVQGKRDLIEFVVQAVGASGGTVLHASEATRAPVYFGIEVNDERIGLLCYPFRCNAPLIPGRALDEHRVQIRYGGQASWVTEHPLAQDVAGVDLTVVLGVHLDRQVFIGLDPLLYDPLPLGISIEFKDSHVNRIQRDSWHVWERENRGGRRRNEPRALAGLETVVGFTPERLLDYARFERQAAALRLDPPLRYRAAEAASRANNLAQGTRHALEQEFNLDHSTLLSIIEDRGRLKVAVKGGVAEHHLGMALRNDPRVTSVQQVDQDGPPDFLVTLEGGRRVGVECKNASPTTYVRAAGPNDEPGDAKVEVQKTRAQKNDPAGRLYRPEQFDVVAACLFATTQRWEFRFKVAADLDRDVTHRARIAPMQRVNRTWSSSLPQALEGSP